MNRKLLVCALSLFATNAFALQPQRGYRGFLEWSNHVGDREYFGLEKKSTFFTGAPLLMAFNLMKTYLWEADCRLKTDG